MAIYEKVCEQCHTKFYAHRSDARFCSAKCTAQFYRDNDNPDYTHAEKERVHWYTCAQCGEQFVVNDYAKREGKRTPRFCSNKCKQAAYRVRVGQDAARRSEQETRPGGAPPKDEPGKRSDQRKSDHYGDAHQDRYEPKPRNKPTFDPYQVLGVARTATAAQIKKAWREKCHIYHPDKNPTNLKWATERMQELNRAYDMLKV